MTRLVGVLITALLLVACVASPGSPRTTAWTTFAELHAPRSFAQAVGLPSGQILVLGGFDPTGDGVMRLDTELVDPLTTAVAQLPQPLLGRLHQSVTLTIAERVVVAGGVERLGDAWSPVDRVDLFDAKTRAWRVAAPLGTPRSDHAAIALADGRVMVIGGNRGTHILTSVERYDPATDSWNDVAPLPHARTQETAVRLLDGRILVAGGLDEHGVASDESFLYDPATDAWTGGPLMTMPRVQHVAVMLPSGDVLLAGGDGAASSTSEVYRWRSGVFAHSGALVEPRMVAQAAALPDGRVVLTGGVPPKITAFTPMAATEVWDPWTGQWSALPAAPTARAWGALVFSDDDLFLIGGSGEGERAYTSVDRLALKPAVHFDWFAR